MYFYAAYGSNLNKKQMLERCPASKPYKGLKLDGYRLVFNGVANIEKKIKNNIFIGIYSITKECEKSLDVYEEFPLIYKKRFIFAMVKGKKKKIMFYAMNNRFDYSVPYLKYFNVIKKGYEDWGFDIINLKNAGKHSLDNNTVRGYKSRNWKEQTFINEKSLNFS